MCTGCWRPLGSSVGLLALLAWRVDLPWPCLPRVHTARAPAVSSRACSRTRRPWCTTPRTQIAVLLCQDSNALRRLMFCWKTSMCYLCGWPGGAARARSRCSVGPDTVGAPRISRASQGIARTNRKGGKRRTWPRKQKREIVDPEGNLATTTSHRLTQA